MRTILEAKRDEIVGTMRCLLDSADDELLLGDLIGELIVLAEENGGSAEAEALLAQISNVIAEQLEPVNYILGQIFAAVDYVDPRHATKSARKVKKVAKKSKSMKKTTRRKR